jgi:hypothetical protein
MSALWLSIPAWLSKRLSNPQGCCRHWAVLPLAVHHPAMAPPFDSEPPGAKRVRAAAVPRYRSFEAPSLFRRGFVEQSFEDLARNRLGHEPIEACLLRIGVIFGLAVSRNRNEASIV